MGNTLEKLVCLVKFEISASTIVNSQHCRKIAHRLLDSDR